MICNDDGKNGDNHFVGPLNLIKVENVVNIFGKNKKLDSLNTYYLGTVHILRNQWDWVGEVGQMIMFYAKKEWFTNEVWLQGGWVGSKKVKILIT